MDSNGFKFVRVAPWFQIENKHPVVSCASTKFVQSTTFMLPKVASLLVYDHLFMQYYWNAGIIHKAQLQNPTDKHRKT